jgi:hypothetical protein
MRRSTITRAARHDLPMVKGAMTMSADRQSSSSAGAAKSQGGARASFRDSILLVA